MLQAWWKLKPGPPTLKETGVIKLLKIIWTEEIQTVGARRGGPGFNSRFKKKTFLN